MPVEALAHFIATHAVLLFFAGMTLLLFVTIALWHLLERYAEPWWRLLLRLSRGSARWLLALLPPKYRQLHQRILFLRQHYLSVHAIGGFIAVFPALLAFAEFADEIDERDRLARFDDALAAALADTLNAGTYRFFSIATHFGDSLTLTALAAGVALVLYRRRQFLLASGWLLAIIGNALLNVSLKAVFQRTRPLHDHGFIVVDGWSFPSGHASGALVAYGMLAYLAIRHTERGWHLPIALLGIALILLVGGSRIMLQVHYFSDVVAGFCSGAAWLAICIAGTEIAARHRQR